MDTKQYNQEYYSINRKKILAQKKEYQKKHKKEVNKRNRKYYHTNTKYRISQQERMKLYKRTWRLKNEYDLTIEKFNELIKFQNNCCAICFGDWGKRKIPFIDHDHKTGKVRGLLCLKCNQGLGMFTDDEIKLQNAINYLQLTPMKKLI